ncbi:MAG TPA: hypothetical protein DER02_13960 [Gammaproteobacteria bacterium]|nr:hypothetical protein [Gammaproteobacteria bacterium]
MQYLRKFAVVQYLCFQVGRYLLAALAFCLVAFASNATEKADLPYRDCFLESAATHQFDPDWLTAIAIVESSLKADAVSSSDAIGLMQIKWPLTARHLGATNKASLFDPCTNVELGARYLTELVALYRGDQEKALAGYRIGPTALMKFDKSPPVVMDYIARIKDQYAILQEMPERADKPKAPQAAVLAEAALPAPSPISDSESPSDAEPELTLEELKQARLARFKRPPKKENLALSREPFSSRQNPNQRDNSAQEADASAADTFKYAMINPDAGTPCNLGELQVLALTTHSPSEREKNVYEWLSTAAQYCSRYSVMKLRNNMPVWLGTAFGSNRIQAQLGYLIETAK